MSATPAYVPRIRPVSGDREQGRPTPRATPAQSDEAKRSPALSVDDVIATARVLIVDDEESNVRILARVLERAGFTNVSGTTNSGEIPSLIAAAEPDIVLLDLHMPGRDGFGILEDLTPLTHGAGGPAGPLPVVMLTGDASAEAKRRALGLGAKDFVAKPFDATEVILRIRNLLETRRLHRAINAQNAALEARVAQRTHELEDAQLEVLVRLAAAGEYRDDDTGRHTQRVGESAARLAQTLGLPAAHVELIRRTAPLHDVGKIGIPDSVLLKPGRLTPEELAVMQTHTTVGAAMLAGGRTPLVQMAERIARSHHERWDGGGYPDGLAGTAIPIEARLVAVVDVYDALASDRPYRRAWEVDRVVAHMREGAGTHFDPAVVEAFLSASDRPV